MFVPLFPNSLLHLSAVLYYAMGVVISNSLTGALRETKEEVGLTLDPKSGRVIRSKIGRVIKGTRFSDIVDVWLFSYDGPVSLNMATTDEVAQSIWLDKKQIKELFDKGDFVDTLAYFFEDKELGGE